MDDYGFQFMSTGCGDEGEHAVLLCCWLLAANIECYLILGTAFPEGRILQLIS